MRLTGLAIACFACFSVTSTMMARADHLGPNQISPTPPERRIGSLELDRTMPQEIIAKYGKPANIQSDTDGADTHRGERGYEWQLPNCKLGVGTYFQPGKESAITSVEVWGSSPSPECSTGRGLLLGSSMASVQRRYRRFQKGRRSTDHMLYVLVEWKDGTQADIDFGKDDKVKHIQIRTSIE